MRRRLPHGLALIALILAGVTGFFVSAAVGQEAPARTVTIDVATGPAGPVGPPGPKGDPGPASSFSCPAGYSLGRLVINHPKGQTAIWTCIAS